MRQHQPFRPREGDRVRVMGVGGEFVVVSLADPALVVLRNQQGREFKAGWRALEPAEAA